MPQALDQCVDIAAPADQVWDLFSTSEGLSGWFVDATAVSGSQGGVTLRFAPGAEATVPVLAWDPPRQTRFGVPGGRVHDITITPTAGGCRAQLQDEGVPAAETDATAAGWAGYLSRLRALAETGR